MRACEVCIGHAPHAAVADGSVGGPWGYGCEKALPAFVIGTLFEPRPCVACGFPTKNIRAGKPHHAGRCPRAPRLRFLGL